ncbi:MAG: hypothetical protein KBT32_01780 [Bacteroidales bacterium]|nr:hypothetical protein [Candidatus Physcocola equi]
MASEKKMCQIRDMYEANKGKDGVTISKICKQSGVPIAEYVEWLTVQTKPKLIPVEVVEQKQTTIPAQTEILIKADLVLPNGLNLRHESISLNELKSLVEKIAVLC